MYSTIRIYVVSLHILLTKLFSSISFPPVLLKREFIQFLSLIPFPEVFAHFLLCEFHYGILRDAMDVYTLAGIPFQNLYQHLCVCALACVRPYTDRVASIAAAGSITSVLFSAG